MAEQKKLKVRLIHKHDTEANWNKAENFIPEKGEIIVYDPDDTYTESRQKIGNGVDIPKNLPFQITSSGQLVGTDGITIDKAESGEKVEISGKNFVEKVTKTNAKLRVYGIENNSTNNYIFEVGAEDIWCKPGTLPRYNQVSYIGKKEPTGALITATPVNDYQCTTKKYVDDYFTANPTLDGSEVALTALQIGDTKYQIKGSLTTFTVGIDSSLLGG